MLVVFALFSISIGALILKKIRLLQGVTC